MDFLPFSGTSGRAVRNKMTRNGSFFLLLRFPPKIRFRDFLLNWFHFRSKSRFFVSVGAETFVRKKKVRKSGKVRIRTIITNLTTQSRAILLSSLGTWLQHSGRARALKSSGRGFESR